MRLVFCYYFGDSALNNDGDVYVCDDNGTSLFVYCRPAVGKGLGFTRPSLLDSFFVCLKKSEEEKK